MYKKFGLVQLGRNFPIISSSETLYLLVHPFWGEGSHPYIDNIERLIRDTEDPILTLDYQITKTMERYAQLGSKGERYFLPNGIPLAVPDCGWEHLAKVISQFNSEKVIVGGSQLSGSKEEGYWHCVGTNYKNLKPLVPNLIINESLSDRG